MEVLVDPPVEPIVVGDAGPHASLRLRLQVGPNQQAIASVRVLIAGVGQITNAAVRDVSGMGYGSYMPGNATRSARG